MIRRVLVRTACAVSTVLLVRAAFAVAPPADGGPLPEAYFQARGKDPAAFTLTRAWVGKVRRLREARESFLAAPAGGPLAPHDLRRFAVTGTLRVPVLGGYFGDQTSAPVTPSHLEQQFFTSNPTGTVSQYYSEVSYGQFTVDGDAYGWTHVTYTNAYYAGTSNGLTPGDAHTGEFIQQIVGTKDAVVDFAQYDNDGPDGTPNSGDDDGFVDVVVIVHSLAGAECGTYPANILSHQSEYDNWPASGGEPYTTDDAAIGGGFIRINDYVIIPALNCNYGVPDGGEYPQSDWIDIGVLCHELIHAFGLPDLYDVDGGGYGIGDWGLLGTGPWNTPERPAHPCAWTRKELGWVVPVTIGWESTDVSIPDIEQNPVAYRLPFTDERFRRSTECVLPGGGNYSLYCGLTEAEGTARGWASPAGGGYGSNWYQTIERDFAYSGAGSVSFQYQYRHDLEFDYDFARTLIEVNGSETELAAYTGVGTGTETIDLTPYLAPLAGGGGPYTLKFRVESDLSLDDADGGVNSTCGALAVDNVSVNGGGESYATGFETYVDGWHQDPAENPESEYWLVENRRKIGSDVNLHGEGLLIWHVDDEVMRAAFQGNRGTGGLARGVVLEEADGNFNLNNFPLNFGEGSDPYPGTLNKTVFDNLSSPGSLDNTQRGTRIAVTSIGPAAPTMSATLRAGNRGPAAVAVAPNVIDNDQVAVVVDVGGLRMRHGATFRFVKSAGIVESPASITDSEDVVATSLEWIDPSLLRGTVNVYQKTGGPWDLVVTNADGQIDTLASALTINHVLAARLRSASIRVVPDGVRLEYELADREAGETLRLSRSLHEDGPWQVIAADLEPDHGETYVFEDRRVESGRTYFYLLQSTVAGGDTREIHRGTASIPARSVVLEQNHPNPFNPTTTIRFYLPERAPVSLDVFDVRGALVRRLAEGTFDAGPHTAAWDGLDDRGAPVSSGVYVYRLAVDKRALTRKMMLLK